VTGDLLFLDEICIPGQGEGDGLYLYPAGGSTSPKKLVASAHVDGKADVFLAKAAWFPDGSGFLFIGGVTETDWRPSLLAYDMKADKVSVVVAAPEGSGVHSVAIAPDESKIVYCVQQDQGGAEDLHLIDLTAASPTDSAITTDGVSCDPSF
jgi:Tol biopolymer transport system component